MNKMIAMGRIAHDLELKTTSNGIPVLKFRIAVDRNYQKSGEEKKTDFFNAVAWRGTAEFIARYFSKGRMILIEGEMQTSDYTDKNGNKVTWYEISVDAAYFTGEKKDDSAAAQGYPVSGGNYQQSPQNYQTAPNYQPAAVPTQPAPNYHAQYATPAPNYQEAQNYQQAADMAAIAAKYAGTAPQPVPAQNGQAMQSAPAAAPAMTPQTAPVQKRSADTYPF